MSEFQDFIKKAKILKEMAEGDYVKRPITFDQDDLDYLSQFPVDHWKQALHDRYGNHLIQALKKREQKRRKYIADNDLVKKITDQLIEKGANPEAAAKQAEHKAWDLSKKAIPHADDDMEEKHHSFANPGKQKPTNKLAKMHINRLIHKLETEEGDDYHPEVAEKHGKHLGEKGKYGFDLTGAKHVSDIDKDNIDVDGIVKTGNFHHSTNGYNAPKEAAIGTSLTAWLNHNQHEMYGKLPKTIPGPNGQQVPLHWKPLRSEGGGRQREDTWSVEEKLREMAKQEAAEMPTHGLTYDFLDSGTVNIPDNEMASSTARKKWATKIADDKLKRGIMSGKIQLFGGPNGTAQPDPVKIKTTASGHKFAYPPIYLPFVKHADGHEYPILNPTKLLRRLGEHPDDNNVPDEDRLGHQKNYVEEPNHNYNSLIKSGALDNNHNTAGRKHLRQGTEEHEIAKNNLFKNLTKVKYEDAELYQDLLKGIITAIKRKAGHSTWQMSKIAMGCVVDLHQGVVIRLMNSLGDKKLLAPGEEGQSHRMNKAYQYVANFQQQDLGFGTRRLRMKKITTSADDAGPGDEGASIYKNYVANKTQEMLGRKAAGKLSPGEKTHITGLNHNPYSLEALNRLPIASNQVVSNPDEIEQITDSGELEANLNARAQVIMQIIKFLSAYYEGEGLSESDIEKNVSAYLDQLNKGGYDLNKMTQTFVKDFASKIPELEKHFAPEADVAPQLMQQNPTQNPTDPQVAAVQNNVAEFQALWKKQDWLSLIKHPVFNKPETNGGPPLKGLQIVFDKLKEALQNGSIPHEQMVANIAYIKALKERLIASGGTA